MDIRCTDIYQGISSATKDIPIVQHILHGLPTGDSCKNKPPTIGKDFCPMLASYAKGLAKDHPEYGKLVSTILPKYCPLLLNDCAPVLCSTGHQGSATFNLSCTDLVQLFNDFLVLPQVKSLNIGSTQKEVCDNLVALSKNNLDQAVSMFSKIFDSFAKTKLHITDPSIYDKQFGSVVKCICPKLGQKIPSPSPPPPGKSVKPLKWKKLQFVVFGILLAIVTFIVLLIVGLTVHLHAANRLALLGIILCTSVVLFVVLLWANPGHLFRYPKLNAGDDWKIIPGTYTGSKTMFGVTIGARVELGKDNKITIDTLACKGKMGCPGPEVDGSHNLIDKCQSKVVSIDTSTKEAQGYRLTGECIDELYNIKTADKSPAVKGIWIQRHGNDYNLLIYLHVCGLPILGCVDPQMIVGVKKV